MRAKQIIATIAIVGTVATLALLNVNQAPAKATFLQQESFTSAEKEFINHISKYHRTYGTKDEYNYRLGVFT
jgi:type II secretory pathway pseudopilin PulG